jgi:hypothetical protein
MWCGELWPFDEFCSAEVIKPVLSGLEACNNRVTGRCVVLRGMLTRRSITAPDMSAFAATSKMEPPPARRQAFDTAGAAWFHRRINSLCL